MTVDQIDAYLSKLDELGYSEINVMEFGSQDGNGIIRAFERAAKHGIKINHLWGFDSFLGLPAEKEGIPCFRDFPKGSLGPHRERQYLLDRIKPYPVTLIEGWFSDLATTTDGMNFPCINAVHLDADLYISTYEALDWMLSKQLIQIGTILSYNEWNSVNGGGESKAHEDICKKWGMDASEYWTCNDGLIQKNFVVEKV